MIFETLVIEHRSAIAKGWIADREGIRHDSNRGFGGQSRTALKVFRDRLFHRCELFGWVTNVRSFSPGASGPVLSELLRQMEEASVDAVGLLVLPDDEAFIPRLITHYGRFGFVPLDDVATDAVSGEIHTGYPVMILPLTSCAQPRNPR